MSVLIVGADGNMGARYKAVLEYLGVPYSGVDKHHSEQWVQTAARNAKSIIIATPTDTHTQVIRTLGELNRPILCEKPLTKDMDDLEDCLDFCRDVGTNLTMVYQYSMLNPGPELMGWTHYNYFRHGSDGLVWDCIQVIGLARGPLALEESSPIWTCTLNGRTLSLSSMDRAYVDFVDNWLRRPGHSLDMLQDIHEKTAEVERSMTHG